MLVARPGAVKPQCVARDRVVPVRLRGTSAPHARAAASVAAPQQGQAAAAAADHGAQQKGRTILLAIDGSPESQHALTWAVQEMHRPGDTFKLVHAIPALPAGRLVAVRGAGLLRVPHVDPALVAEKAAAEAAHGELARTSQQQLKDAGVSCTFEVLTGPLTDAKSSISKALCARARADGAAAVVVASASKGGLQEALMGSVAANLARDCSVPVVVLHKPREQGSSSSSSSSSSAQAQAARQQQQQHDVTWLLKASAQELLGHAIAEAAAAHGEAGGSPPAAAGRNLVVAVDDGEEGYAAVSYVLQHLWRPGDVVHLLHVVPALPAHMSYSLAPDGMLYTLPLPQLEEAQVEEQHWRELLLARLGPLLQSRRVAFELNVLTDYGTDPLSGVASAVVSVAEQLAAAALVVSGHRKGSLAEWLLGSVSDFAIHRCAVPVVVLHAAPGGSGEQAQQA